MSIKRADSLGNITLGHVPMELPRFVFFFPQVGGSVTGKLPLKHRKVTVYYISVKKDILDTLFFSYCVKTQMALYAAVNFDNTNLFSSILRTSVKRAKKAYLHLNILAFLTRTESAVHRYSIQKPFEKSSQNYLNKRRLWDRYVPVNFMTFFRTTFLQNTSRQLLL